MEEVEVIVVGAGPAGLATSGCLNRLNISNIVLEKEDCCGSLWKKRAYDRLKLHLAKQFCQLPHMPYPQGKWSRLLRHEDQKWCVTAKNMESNDVLEVYSCKFLVVATGENSEGYIPQLSGFESFKGEFMHSSKYENGKAFSGKEVLVIGCGNSGMEIAYDLTNYNVKTSICVRNPVHVLTTEIVFVGMFLLKVGFPLMLVDMIVVILSILRYGNISKYGFKRPKQGPFRTKNITGRTPPLMLGIKNIEGKIVKFENGEVNSFDGIIFATGYKSTVNYWLKDENLLFTENGMPKSRNDWKGQNGLYCAGFSGRGLLGISKDAENIANDISFVLDENKRRN
ncbi:hypothetical protein FNV43_RR18403 [Rhamnella rubrinervis]|uniref:Flavin-containing monooxygenase n=1 Tax=Rhamnella rubrinervis TaxID=2594499 RepID=A0A8K0GY22_9ROSA|nr:hypothetical protein FNV43_RR18403 [Rhamnella rubrinervis]